MAESALTNGESGNGTTKATYYKDQGNQSFANQEYVKAATTYKLGLALASAEEETETIVALRCNLAMAYLKTDKHLLAKQECDVAIEVVPAGSETEKKYLTKLYYRRALAREELRDMEGAIDDLNNCLTTFQHEAAPLDAGQKKMKDAASKALARVKVAKEKLQTEPAPQSNYPQQRQDVVTLLQSRQTALQPLRTKPGEAFFLLDFCWWQKWCDKVQLFADPKAAILNLLPPDTTVPADYDEDEDEDDDDEGLGSIDNSGLLMRLERPFVQHWYDCDQGLRPNLVRGRHYELVPREVYQALKSWYGETTEPICRRVAPDGFLYLYSHQGGDNDSTRAMDTTDDQNKPCGACRAPNAKCRCTQCQQVWYCAKSCQESHWPLHKQDCKNGSAPMALDRYMYGRVGLHNLGNTCFMNSALQCLSHATPLTRHFLSQTYMQDLNVQNPLGTGGKLAHAYNQVMREIWMSGPSATSPTTLKRAIAMFAPRFAGCLQHDAQEFLAYLLDGLHEDMNRIRKAPYVEMPDVDENTNMAIAGAEAWDGHNRRNDSLVMDTFYGQFKSTCVCPRCKRVSVSFDAFNHISLEIPQPQSNRFLPVIDFTAVGGVPIRRMVEVRRGSPVADVRKNLSQQIGIPAERFAICDIYEHSIYEVLPDTKNINTVRTADVLAVFNIDPYTNQTIHVVGTHFVKGGKGKELFGFPFLASFNTNMTCRGVYEQVWGLVSHIPGIQREWIQIRITDLNGKDRPVFGGSSSIPSDSDEPIRQYIGDECLEKFIFLSLEWKTDAANVDKTAFDNIQEHPTYLEAAERERVAANNRKRVTLGQCFQTFTRPERLDENNMWYCNKCQDHVRAMKTMELWRLPNILIVHLKRFEFKNSLRRDKLDTFVDFPLDGLDMSKCCGNAVSGLMKDQIPAEYDLFAVTNHFGRLGFGHYTAFARSWDEGGMSKDWALFDDSSVRSVGDGRDSVVSPAAYVLFYRRRKFD